ncbi:hypothetical protein DQ384_07835 [Sphaerisporangium album]|uniref:Uncharacterized protein n=1 Tax=Sphaerisporangium album TaxID=509200 RepID=A0A367FP46_9ACTN|nr:hypothetical protein DQ384_07835 [Sphaerisporangium album]
MEVVALACELPAWMQRLTGSYNGGRRVLRGRTRLRGSDSGVRRHPPELAFDPQPWNQSRSYGARRCQRVTAPFPQREGARLPTAVNFVRVMHLLTLILPSWY